MSSPLVRVEARFKNALLYNAIEAAALPVREYRHGEFGDWGKMRAFCEFHSLPYDAVGQLVRLQSSPLAKTSGGLLKVRPICTKLSEILGRSIAELFPAELYNIKWPVRLVAEVEANRFKSLGDVPTKFLALPPAQEADLVQADRDTALEAALLTLTPREADVLRLRFGIVDGEEHTLRDVGDKYGVSVEQMRQIEAKAMRKMRHPTRSRSLKQFLDA